jgi:hypothetical protein
MTKKNEATQNDTAKGRYTSQGRGKHNRQEGSYSEASPANDPESLRKAETPVYHGNRVLFAYRFIRRNGKTLYGFLTWHERQNNKPRKLRGLLFADKTNGHTYLRPA